MQERPKGATLRPRSGGAANRRYPASKVRGGGREELPHAPKPEARGSRREELPHAPKPEARGGSQEEQPTSEPRGGDERPGRGCACAGGPKGAIPH